MIIKAVNINGPTRLRDIWNSWGKTCIWESSYIPPDGGCITELTENKCLNICADDITKKIST